MLHAKKINIGLLAHVDAGKTTLAERILLETGNLRKAGRVDHGDAFLDTDETEKRRGITIYSKMAQAGAYTLIDTPGHADFSAEMERTLQILDYAVLIISGPDGVQGHVMTLWRLLAQYEVPTVVFVNKMDQPGTDRVRILAQLKERLGEGFVEMPEELEPFEEKAPQEDIALLEDSLLERYLEGEAVTLEDAKSLLVQRRLFPCWFGSALRGDGVAGFLSGLKELLPEVVYPEEFSARVYKITRDLAGKRLTWMKITGGELRAKQLIGEEKAEQLTMWSGASSKQVSSASAGEVVAVTGLDKTRAGMGLGAVQGQSEPLLEPVLTYQILLPPQCDVHETFLKLKMLEEELPELHLAWESASQSIHAQLMGEVQTEILTETIQRRFGISVGFGAGKIVYRETITGIAEGVGHYEPLRHYAEVQLALEGLENGSGMEFGTAADTDSLALNWQRLILTHLEEKVHAGVLIGAPLTDVRITLLAGRAHEKHTEGGDFRQAVYRAVRQGLMRCREEGRCVLLEPVYAFRLELPERCLGHAIADIQRMSGTFETESGEKGSTVLSGMAPVSEMQGYQAQVSAYTGGEGRMFCRPGGYQPCHNTQEVLEAAGYDPDADTDNPAGSIFCSHGAGIFIPWQQVPEYMHLESVMDKQLRRAAALAQEAGGAGPGQSGQGNPGILNHPAAGGQSEGTASGAAAGGAEPRHTPRVPRWNGVPADVQDDKELMAIFTRTYGSGEKRDSWKRTRREWSAPASGGGSRSAGKEKQPPRQYLLVDGYNMIYAWKELSELAQVNLDAARMALADILANYRGYRKMTLILVFDAYKVEGGTEHVQEYSGIHMVFTKEAETADAYIERAVKNTAAVRNADITVATSDAAEQMIIWGEGARRMSARELREEIEVARSEIRSGYLDRAGREGKRYLFAGLDEQLRNDLEKLRLGKS